jgi:S-adenosylmethionine:tRNA ribosyltransferase-isomerase
MGFWRGGVMKAADFDYDLPPSAIAQHPIEPRDAARLLVHERAYDQTSDRHVRDLPEILRAGDLLVVNDTRVRPARLYGRRASGGRVELLLLTPEGNSTSSWRAFVRPAKRLHAGDALELEGGLVRATAVRRIDGEDGRPGPEWVLDLEPDGRFASLEQALESAGRMPLPPYIHRDPDGDPADANDRERYQTVFAARTGAIAAPTAGLHFTSALMDRLRASGIGIASLTLHVGAGTFLPMQTEDLGEHAMHAEDYVLPQDTVDAIAHARARGGRVIAVGTTSARVLESCTDESGAMHAGSGSTRLFIQPGRTFRGIDGLLTNFHLPRSTLVVLVSAFAGRDRVLRLYREALERGYRFYSFGDAMLLL